jgi:tagatose-1,6-bisphosphate aldolase
LNVTHNMFTQLVATYLETYVDEILGDYHCGFRRSRPEIDHSCSLRIIVENSCGYCVHIYYLCTEYKQVYDTNLRKSPTTALYVLIPLYSHCTFLQGTALKGLLAESTDTFCEQDQQNVS